MKVEIIKKTLLENLLILMDDDYKNYILVNGEKRKYDLDRFVFQVYDAVETWPQKLIDEKVLDGLAYKIVIEDKGKKSKYQFVNEFPEDIWRLEKLIKEALEAENV